VIERDESSSGGEDFDELGCSEHQFLLAAVLTALANELARPLKAARHLIDATVDRSQEVSVHRLASLVFREVWAVWNPT
jgi:hypothetical protein